MDPFNTDLKPDTDIHYMDEEQKLATIKRDLLASGANLRNKMLSE